VNIVEPCPICGNTYTDPENRCLGCKADRTVATPAARAARRGGGLTLAGVIVVLALLCGGGAFAYRAIVNAVESDTPPQQANPLPTFVVPQPNVAGPTATRSPQPPAPGLAKCVVGHWRETSNVATLSVGGQLVTTGGRQIYGADGSYVLDYTNATQTTQNVEYKFHGKVTGRYTLNGSGADYSDPVPSGTYQVLVNGTVTLEGALPLPALGHDELTCSGNHLTQHGTTTDTSSGVAITVTGVVELTRE
jgi:hypothetical protein